MAQRFYGSIAVGNIILDGINNTISGANLNLPVNINWNEPDVIATFEKVVLSDANILANSTDARLVVQLPNTNDAIYVDYRGAIFRQNATTLQANWILGAPEANNGHSFRINTSQPNLQLYAPDSGGAVALYNTANSNYSWYLGSAGDASFANINARNNVVINGNLEVNGVINGVVQSQAVPVIVNANYVVPNDGNNYELIVNASSVGTANFTITVPEDPIHQMEINIVVVDLGTANFIAVGDGSPELSFVANGLRTFVDLKGRGLSKTTFKYVNYGLGTDWWTVSPY